MTDIRAEIVGSVIEVAAPGRLLPAGDPVVVLESMKMEIPVTSEEAGIVRSVEVGVGDVVRDGDLLAVLDGPGDPRPV
jgi:acetyl-CoA carboxylase biotin carboxyl carrier protein